MPADYEIVSVAEGDKWDKDFGQGTQYFQSYDLVLKGPGAPNTPVSLNRKRSGAEGSVPADKVPLPDTTLYGSIEDGKFKTAQRQEGSQNGSSGDGPTEEYWEAKNLKIQRQAAHKAMCSVYELGRTENVIPKAETKEEFFNALRLIAEWLDRDTERAAAEPVVGGILQPPADPPPEPVTDDSSIPF